MTCIKIIAFACIAIFEVLALSENRIINHESERVILGYDAKDGDIPYQALILVSVNDSVVDIACGGTIIDSKHILTAAHCLENYETFAKIEDILIYTGRITIEDEIDMGAISEVQNITIHPQFIINNFVNDIAILKIKGEFKEGVNLKFAKINPTKVSVDEECLTSGWGVTNITDLTSSSELKILNVTLINGKECSAEFEHALNASNLNFTLCSRTSPNDLCAGDAGGPLICNGQVVGMSSYVYGCEVVGLLPVSYVDIYKYKDWIDEMRSLAIQNSINISLIISLLLIVLNAL